MEASTPSILGFGGIVNMGFTCYANAMIQVLRHIPRVKWLLEDGRYNTLFKGSGGAKRTAQESLTRSYAEITQLLWKCKKGQSVRPADFWKEVGVITRDTLYEHLATRAPHDSHEFFSFILETIHEATAQEVEMQILKPPPSTEEEKLVHGALTAWQREFSREYSPFIDLFYGLYHWRTVCQTCMNCSHRWESFNSLKISVPGVNETGGVAPRLQDLLLSDMTEEVVEGYHCEVCPERTTAKRSMRIWRLPQTIVLVLKRFNATGSKIHTRVTGGEEIDFATAFSENSPEKAGVTRYNLRGVVDHHGSSFGGHYTAQCKSHVDGIWYFYDDEGVGEMAAPFFGESTYVLVLERGEAAPAAPAAAEA
jgi:ubiquitin carboxyl-terminal hydrolase 2/21